MVIHIRSAKTSLMHESLGDLLPGFETHEEVLARRREIIRRLDGGDADESATQVRNVLHRCRKGGRCRSAACPVCTRTLRRFFIRDAIELVAKLQKEGEINGFHCHAFSAVLAEEQHALGQLAQADLRLINERLQRRHSRADLPLVFAGVDVSHNEDSAGRWPPHWQFQVYGIVVGLGFEGVKERLAGYYPSTDRIPRPLRVRFCSEIADALSYTLKAKFVRRVSYVDDTGRMNTRKTDLKPPQLRELAAWLGQYPVSSRYVLTGCRRSGDQIVLLPSPDKT